MCDAMCACFLCTEAEVVVVVLVLVWWCPGWV